VWYLQVLRETRYRSCRTNHRFSDRNRRALYTGGKTIDQVTLLSQDIDDSFSPKKKAGTVLADLTSSCDTVCQRSLTWKLLRLLPDRHMVRLIMELVGNRSFTLTTGSNKWSKLQLLENGVPQGSVLSPLLVNFWLANHRLQKACKLCQSSNHACWRKLASSKRSANQRHGDYKQITPDWKLNLRSLITTSTVHLNNKETKPELKVNSRNEQARSNGGHSGAVPPKYLLYPPKFSCSQKNLF